MQACADGEHVPEPPAFARRQRPNYPNGLPRSDVLTAFAKLYAIRGTVYHRSEYDDLARQALTFEDEPFLWSKRTIGQVAREIALNDEKLDATSRIQDAFMDILLKSRLWQFSYIMSVYLTKDVAEAMQNNRARVLRGKTTHAIAQVVMDKVEHPKNMWPIISVFGHKIHNTLKSMIKEEAENHMQANGYFLTKHVPRLALRDKKNRSFRKTTLMQNLRGMKVRSAGTFTKKNAFRIFTRYRDRRAAGSTDSRGEWNSIALTGPGARRFLNLHTGRAAKAKDKNESEAACTEFSKLLLHLWRAYRILTGTLVQKLQMDGLLNEAAAVTSHRERTATVDDMQFLACEFYEVLTKM